MRHRVLVAILVLLALVLATATLPAKGGAGTSSSGNLLGEALSLLEAIQRLHEAGFNTTSLALQLNRTIAYIQGGETGKAAAMLEKLRGEVRELALRAPEHRLLKQVEEITVIIVLLAIPFLFYRYAPRLYLRLWVKLHRRWIVE